MHPLYNPRPVSVGLRDSPSGGYWVLACGFIMQGLGFLFWGLGFGFMNSQVKGFGFGFRVSGFYPQSWRIKRKKMENYNPKP